MTTNEDSSRDIKFVLCDAIAESRDDELALRSDSLYLTWLVTKTKVLEQSSKYQLPSQMTIERLEEAQNILLGLQRHLNGLLRFYSAEWNRSNRVIGTGFHPEHVVRRIMRSSPTSNWINPPRPNWWLEGRVVDMKSAADGIFPVHANIDYIAYDGIEFSYSLKRYFNAHWMRSSYLDGLIIRTVLMQSLVLNMWRYGDNFERVAWSGEDLTRWNTAWRGRDQRDDRFVLREHLRQVTNQLSLWPMLSKHSGFTFWIKRFLVNLPVPAGAAYWFASQPEPASAAGLALSLGLMLNNHQTALDRSARMRIQQHARDEAVQARRILRNTLVNFEDLKAFDVENMKNNLYTLSQLGFDVPGHVFTLLATSPEVESGVTRAGPSTEAIDQMHRNDCPESRCTHMPPLKEAT